MQDITDEILTFWFGTRRPAPKDTPQEFWFKSTDTIDNDIKARFGKVHQDAMAGAFEHVANTSDDYLALILLLDQFPRNIHRGTPAAFASDPIALYWSRRGIERGFDLQQPAPHRRVFFYLPFEHSEDLSDQDMSVDLISQTGSAGYIQYAHLHRDVIARYGRFPHRNRILNRVSRSDEEAYLAVPGSGF